MSLAEGTGHAAAVHQGSEAAQGGVSLFSGQPTHVKAVTMVKDHVAAPLSALKGEATTSCHPTNRQVVMARALCLRLWLLHVEGKAAQAAIAAPCATNFKVHSKADSSC